MTDGRHNHTNVIPLPKPGQRIPSRLLVIGQAPGHGEGPGSAAKRFAKLLGIPVEELWTRFELYNLNLKLRGKDGLFDLLDLNEAQARAAKIEEQMRRDPYDLVIAWGIRTAQVMGAPVLGWKTTRGARWLGAIPHPSGKNRWWNDPENRSQAYDYTDGVIAYLEGLWDHP